MLRLLLIGVLCVSVSQVMAQEAPVVNEKPVVKEKQVVKKGPKKNAAFDVVVDDPALPRVLIIGDSISIGYTADVRTFLKGVANVHRIPVNGGPTTRGLESIDQWLGTSTWDVIHFNWGLHDLKYINDNNVLVDPPEGHQQVPLDEYKKNLETLVTRLEKTGAKLIWRTTTPVPEGSDGRVVGDAKKYNDVAAKIMEKHGIAVDDQYSYCLPRLKEMQLPANVHFTPEGYKELAQQAAIAIEAALAGKK